MQFRGPSHEGILNRRLRCGDKRIENTHQAIALCVIQILAIQGRCPHRFRRGDDGAVPVGDLVGLRKHDAMLDEPSIDRNAWQPLELLDPPECQGVGIGGVPFRVATL